MRRSSNGLFCLAGRTTLLLGLALLTVMSVGLSVARAVDDEENPNNFNWAAAGYLTWVGLIPSTDHPYWWSYKAVEATSSLTYGHCITGEGTELRHLHSQFYFSGSYVTCANNFWDWYYDQCSGIVRVLDEGATNKINCLSYALHEYATSANYDYWVQPGNDPGYGNYMFYDDLWIRSYYPNLSAQADDRIEYHDVNGVILHVTIVRTVADGKPSFLEWKNNASGVYRWYVGNQSDDERWSTPGSIITHWEYCEDPEKDYYRHYWPYMAASVWYAD